MARVNAVLLLGLLGILGLGLLFGQVRWIPALAANEAAEYPGAIGMIALLSVVGISLGVCAQLGLLSVARLIILLRREGRFDRRAVRWIDTIAISSVVAGAIVLTSLIVLESVDGSSSNGLAPGFAALLLGLVIGLIALAMLMATLRAPLTTRGDARSVAQQA